MHTDLLCLFPVQLPTAPGLGWALSEPSRGMLLCLTLLQVCLSADHLLKTPLDSSKHWSSPAAECCFQDWWLQGELGPGRAVPVTSTIWAELVHAGNP